MDWRIETLTGRKVPARVHLVDCGMCEGAGEVLGEGAGNANDPGAKVFKCEDCNGGGQVRCADDGCCDYDPPEDDE